MIHRTNGEPGEPADSPSASAASVPDETAGNTLLTPATASKYEISRLFIGPEGLRAGWSLLLFAFLMYLFGALFGAIMGSVLGAKAGASLAPGTPISSILSEGDFVLALAVVLLMMARIEHRSVQEYYLCFAGGARRFLGGLVAGFAALSLLVEGMACGGWMHIGAVTLSRAQIVTNGALWGLAFLFVGLVEEGTFRCYVQFTLSRGMNFWWALGVVGAMCVDLLFTEGGHGQAGIYGFALAGLVPCVWLYRKRSAGNGFWYAAWAGSTGFGFIHTFNRGENWIGIFAAAAIGLVFCVSVRLTGSAWWAIGCHASWDWAETYFYGTADSGLPATGHLLTTTPAGSALWSGGTDGPEGSLLVLPVIALLLAAVILVYGRRRAVPAEATAIDRLAS